MRCGWTDGLYMILPKGAPACGQSKTGWKTFCQMECGRVSEEENQVLWTLMREGFTSLVGRQHWEKIWGKWEAVDMDIEEKLVDWNIYMNIRKKSKKDKHLPGKLSGWILRPRFPSLSPPFLSSLCSILFVPLSCSFDTSLLTADVSSIGVCWWCTPLIPSL